MTDDINDAIWSESPARQLSLQPPNVLAEPGAVGAQQAMVGDNEILPWVPDLLGDGWRDTAALLVVGSAYAGFIAEFSGRHATMPLSVYRAARSWQAFQARFLEHVVQPDRSYYRPILQLVGGTLRSVALFDLCRASFVRRGEGLGRRFDKSNDNIVCENGAVFSAYVDAQTDWTWRRITQSNARRIVALGRIAEHGLHRLFLDNGMTITERAQPFSITMHPVSVWPCRYADSERKLGHWLEQRSWWTATGCVDGHPRQWQILPALHPSRSNFDPGYNRTRTLLTTMQ